MLVTVFASYLLPEWRCQCGTHGSVAPFLKKLCLVETLTPTSGCRLAVWQSAARRLSDSPKFSETPFNRLKNTQSYRRQDVGWQLWLTCLLCTMLWTCFPELYKPGVVAHTRNRSMQMGRQEGQAFKAIFGHKVCWDVWDSVLKTNKQTKPQRSDEGCFVARDGQTSCVDLVSVLHFTFPRWM